MQLRTDWKHVAKRAWSFRFNVLATVFGGAEVVVSILSDHPPIPRGTFAALAFAVSIAAGLSRLVVQAQITPEDAQ